jgi:CelD/BcsL family acetyltransferase involved in cellulose biosynthesis
MAAHHPMQNRIAVAPSVRATSAVAQPERRLSLVPKKEEKPEPFALRIDRKSRAFADALARWQELAQGAPPMLTPEFTLLTARLLGETEVVLFGALRGGSLTAAMPMARRGRTLLAVHSDHTPRVDLIGDAASVPALWHAVREAGGWDVLELRALPADSALASMLPDLARKDRCRVHVRETTRAPWFLVDGIEQRIHRRFRGDMRRLERQMGGVELERVSSFDRTALNDVLRLEAAAWKGAAGTAIACDPRLASFYAGLARVFARKGGLTMAFLRARGARIAAQFALEDATTFHLLKVGYDPEYAHFGPGQILVREAAADAARRGLVRYDLMGKDTAWKMKWTSLVRPHVEMTIYAPSMGGRVRHFVHEVARPATGRALRGLRGRRARPS